MTRPPDRIRSVLEELGIPAELISARTLPIQSEARELVVAELGESGREHLLIPAAATAWKQLATSARADGVQVRIASAFRSVERQAEIIRGKLGRGQTLDAILRTSAPPGFSEHHTGFAVDVATPGCPSFDAAFARTDAFRWLSLHAQEFGFALSYPEGNASGYEYEPWHWCFHS